jgi:hypothetical protein
MRKILAVMMVAALAACGGSDEGDVKDVPGVDASGTADTEIFTQDPDTAGVPTAAQGGTMADSTPMGGGGMGGNSTGTTTSTGGATGTGTQP